VLSCLCLRVCECVYMIYEEGGKRAKDAGRIAESAYVLGAMKETNREIDIRTV